MAFIDDGDKSIEEFSIIVERVDGGEVCCCVNWNECWEGGEYVLVFDDDDNVVDDDESSFIIIIVIVKFKEDYDDDDDYE